MSWRCFHFPCPNVPVEELWTFNPLCGGQDPQPVCREHLEEHMAEALLRPARAVASRP